MAVTQGTARRSLPSWQQQRGDSAVLLLASLVGDVDFPQPLQLILQQLNPDESYQLAL